MKRKTLLISINIIFIIFITGCWNYSEMEDQLLVAGFSVDQGKGEVPYLVTVEVLIPKSETSMDTALVQADGYTILDALRNIASITGKKLYLGHCRTMVICRSIAEQGIADLLDALARDHELRFSINIVVCNHSPAWQLYKRETVGDIKNYTIEQGLEEVMRYSGKSFAVNIAETLQALNQEGIELLLPVVEQIYCAGAPTFRMAGLAVFDKDKLVGFLTPEEAKYVLLIRNEIKGGVLLSAYETEPDLEGKEMSYCLEIYNCKSKLKVKGKDGKKIKLSINTKVEAGLASTDTKIKYDKKSNEKICESFENTLDESINTVIKRVQSEFGTDVFGFGLYIYKHKHKMWNDVKENWNDYFKEIEVDVNSSIKIRQSGLTRDTIKKGDKH